MEKTSPRFQTETKDTALQLLYTIVEGTYSDVGEKFLYALIRQLAQALQAEYAWITECVDRPVTKLRVLAFWKATTYSENFTYDIQATPCNNVVHGELCYYPKQLQSLFAEDSDLVELNAESYVGIPLYNSESQLIGHLAVMSTQTMSEKEFITSVLKVFAARAQSELQRIIQENHNAYLLRQMSQINESLTSFAQIVSHDLKAPLHNIQYTIHLFEEDYAKKLDENGLNLLRILSLKSRQLEKLIVGILEYSQAGYAPNNQEKVSISTLISECIELLSPPAHVRVNRPEHLPTVNGSETGLKQVFQNILSNAIKYNDKAIADIHISFIEAESHWQFQISDNGPGIPENALERIFNLFETLVSKDLFESSGIGLSVVKRIVKAHGGNVWVTSELEKGTCFNFTIEKLH